MKYYIYSSRSDFTVIYDAGREPNHWDPRVLKSDMSWLNLFHKKLKL